MAPDTTYYEDGSNSTGRPIDQLSLYDTAILDWLESDYDIIPGKTVKYPPISVVHHGYSEVLSQQNTQQDRLTTPRILVTRLDHTLDTERFNPTQIRRLGKTTTSPSGGLDQLRKANFPVPIILNYQIDFWCEFVREMNLWEQKFLYQYAFGYKYFQIYVDSIWGNKKVCVFLDGGMLDNSELEPGQRPREIRKTVSLRVLGWIFDQSYEEVKVVKDVALDFYDYDTEVFIEEGSPNRRDADLYTADGIVSSFTGNVLSDVPILENSFLLKVYFSGTEIAIQDNGSGSLFGDNITSGTIDYTTGEVDITFDTAPDAGDLSASWLTDLD